MLGAPIYALLAVGLLRLAFWRRVIAVHDELRFPPRLVALAMLSSYTHLALDWTTFWGVPLAFPLTDARYTAGWFFYSVAAMVPFSAWLAWRVARGRAGPSTYRRVGTALVVVLLVAGGIRATTYPRDVEADVAHAASAEWAWTTFERTPTGWNVTFWSLGREVGNATYHAAPPEGAAAERAWDAAQASIAYRKLRLYGGGPFVVQVSAREDGGHNVTVLDLMERAQADRAPWFPFFEDAGVLRLAVDPDGRVTRIEE